ncbi:amino acid synthesis family protein [Actinomadura sp. 6N118]|uniref:amino acid synthesis family protein n=1 Tax=Actinomadura sp. 6N118 TaxID=3375151 RepID=UPI00379AEB0C
MREPNFEGYHIRKWFTYIEDTLATETGALADGAPVRKIVIAAAVHNPYAGRHGETLDEIVGGSAKLGLEFGRRVQAAAGGQPIESYGKACLVGADGEYEHGNAFLTQVFADPVREAVGGGKSWVPSTGKRGAPGSSIDVPLAHKDALYVRSHYDTITVGFTDAPAPDEVVAIFAFATRGRLHARLGGLAADAIEGRDGLR